MSASNAAIAAVRNCAMAMLQNASFIRHELPHVNITDVHRTEAEAVCDAFIGTKHDVFSDLGELSDALVAHRANQGEVIRRLDRINALMRDDLNAMHHLVQGLHDALDEKKRNSNAYILVSESTVNVLNAFRAAHDAINALRHTTRRARPPTLVIASSYEVECAEIIDGAPKVQQVAQFVRKADAAEYADRAREGTDYAVTEVLRHNVVARCWNCRVPLTHEMTILFGQFQDDPIAFCKCPKCGTKYGYEVRLDESEKAISRYQARKAWRTAIPEDPRPGLPGMENYRLGPPYWFGGADTPDPVAAKCRRLVFGTAYDVDVCEVREAGTPRLHTVRFNDKIDAAEYAKSERARSSPTAYAFIEEIRHDEPALCNRCHVPLIHFATVRFGADADDPIAFCKCPRCDQEQTYEV